MSGTLPYPKSYSFGGNRKRRDLSVTAVVNSAILDVTATNLTRIKIPRNPSQKKHKANSAQDNMESDRTCYSGFDSGCA